MQLTPEQRTFALGARRAVLATIRDDARPRLVPICFALLELPAGDVLVTPIDEKPKRSGDPRRLGRVRDVLARPAVTVLVDRWDEDWSRLAWLRIDGAATLVEPGGPLHEQAVAALRRRYPQYVDQALERLPVLAIEPVRIASWHAGAAEAAAEGARGDVDDARGGSSPEEVSE